MTIDDITSMDLTPILIVLAIIAVILVIFLNVSNAAAKTKYNNLERQAENDLKVISKDLGDLINIGGTVAAPVKGYRCTFVFERKDGSRLVLKTSKANVYEQIIIGDKGTAVFKGNILENFIRTNNYM